MAQEIARREFLVRAAVLAGGAAASAALPLNFSQGTDVKTTDASELSTAARAAPSLARARSGGWVTRDRKNAVHLCSLH